MVPFSSSDARPAWHSQFSSVGSDCNTFTSILKCYIFSNLFPVIAFHTSTQSIVFSCCSLSKAILVTQAARLGVQCPYLGRQAWLSTRLAASIGWSGVFPFQGLPSAWCKLRVSGCPSCGEQILLCYIVVWGPASLALLTCLSCADIKMCGQIWDTWYSIFRYDMVNQVCHLCIIVQP